MDAGDIADGIVREFVNLARFGCGCAGVAIALTIVGLVAVAAWAGWL